jgi:hypothetical protein
MARRRVAINRTRRNGALPCLLSIVVACNEQERLPRVLRALLFACFHTTFFPVTICQAGNLAVPVVSGIIFCVTMTTNCWNMDIFSVTLTTNFWNMDAILCYHDNTHHDNKQLEYGYYSVLP